MAKTRRTYQPHKTKRLTVHGFMARNATVGGRNVLRNRRAKGRKELTVSDDVREDKTKRFKRIK